MTGHGCGPERSGMFEVPGSRLQELTDTIADLRAKLAAAEQERDGALASMNAHRCGDTAERAIKRASAAEAALAAVRESLNELDAAFAEWEESPNLYSPGFAVRFLREHLDAALAAVEQGEPTPEQP